MTTDPHPLELELIQFAQGALADLEFERIAAHLEHCAQCADVLRRQQLALKLGEAVTTHSPITEVPRSGEYHGRPARRSSGRQGH
jgi:hypothetical protein